MKRLLASLITLTLLFGMAFADDHEETKEEAKTVHSFKAKNIKGEKVDLSKYKGKVLVIVNTASECGYTPQYEDLQALHEKYKEKGLVILGFPSNQFGGQEPGSDAEIAQFCEAEFGVAFPMMSKIDVKGSDQHPLYKHLTSEKASPEMPGDVKWNFEKFVVGKDGKVVKRFRSRSNPRSEEVVKVIETELRK